MSSKVEVLCPNGHRVNVKITPNTKVLQILEEACKKQGFLPASDYELKHGRRSLDVTLSVRYAGIPNLGKLELVKSSKTRTESEVTIALQMPNGERMQHQFTPDTRVWEVLKFLETQPNSPVNQLIQCTEEDQHPVCIYMREEVIGQYAMENTSLRSLGLTGGKAMLRLAQRSVPSDIISQINDKIDKEKLRQEKIAAKSSEVQTKETDSVNTNKKTVDTIKEEQVNDNVTELETKREKTKKLLFPQGTRPKTKPTESTSASLPTGAMIYIPTTESSPPSGADVVHLTPEQEDLAQTLAQAISPAMMQQDTAERARLREERLRNRQIALKMQQRQQQQQQLQLAEFKFPESSKGQDLYHNELNEVNKEDFKPCDRETVIYKLEEIRDTSPVPMETDELSDDFFQVNERDVKNMWADLQKQLKEMDNQPLQTNVMKLAAKETRMAKYKRVVIRFFFPERIVIQALFRPKETVHALNKFVKEYLEDKSIDFYLYTTPPKCVLKDKSSTMIEADLAPMSVIYFGSVSKRESYLSAAVKNECTTENEAYKVLVKNTPKPTKTDVVTSNNRPAPTRTTSNRTNLESGKVPKWFKIGRR